jgi:hypothetical protein
MVDRLDVGPHMRSFQLSQSSLSAVRIRTSPLARASADCAARIVVIDAAAAVARDPKHVPADLGHLAGLDRAADLSFVGAGSLRTASQYSGGICSAGPTVGDRRPFVPTAALAAIFSICFELGVRQLAGLSEAIAT